MIELWRDVIFDELVKGSAVKPILVALVRVLDAVSNRQLEGTLRSSEEALDWVKAEFGT